MGERVAAAAAAALALGLAGCSGAAPEPRGPEGILATITTPPSLLTSTPAPRPAETSSSTAPADAWYLALGDSLAAGLQPTTGDQKDRGYAGPVLESLRGNSPRIQLKNLGCSGETTTTMLSGNKSCPYPEGNQVAAALAFLKANAATTRLVTLDIGANDVLGCVDRSGRIDQTCAKNYTATVARQLPSILGKIRAVAPDVDLVLLNYYNPLLAGWLKGAPGKDNAERSKPLLAGLNGEITKAAKAANAKVADVASAFATSDNGGSPQPNNVKRICDWTWMCSSEDIHANDDGYAAMAKAVLDAR